LEFLYLAARGHRHLRNDFEMFGQILASQLVGLKVSYHFGEVEALAGSSAVGIFSWRTMASNASTCRLCCCAWQAANTEILAR